VNPDIVTVVACPPEGTRAASIHNNFIDEVYRALVDRKAAGTRIVRAATVRDMDLRLGEILTPQFRGRVKLQIVGHSLSGALLLGAAWLANTEMFAATFNPPFYALTPDPRALGFLVNYVGKISEVMLVGCNVGSDSSYGYPLNGRTLTYALAELLQCQVRGADDVVAPEEFDAHGWYTPGPGKRRPQGWRWVECSHPEWVDGGPETSPRHRAETVVSFEIRSIMSTLLPVPEFPGPLELRPPIHITCRQLDSKRVPSSVPEIALDTDQGTAYLLGSGRYLNIGDTYYAVERHARLLEIVSQHLWQHPRTGAGRAAGHAAGAR
jgi:hypothetical protein